MADGEIIIRDPEGGTNQSGLRDQNARLVLSFIRRHGEMASAEIARRSGLSAQTVSNIIRALESDGLLRRGDAVKGKVGKPSVPVTLNPGGVFSVGLNIGRRSAELVLVDFTGRQIETRSTTYAFPLIPDVLGFLQDGLADFWRHHPHARGLVTGIGVSRPNRLWDWLETVNAPSADMRAWKALDLTTKISQLTGYEAVAENDATSACVAEHLQGRGGEFSNFGYIFLGAFVGGGLVLNNKVVSGATLNAAALGPLPVPDGQGGATQLLNRASLYLLEEALGRDGLDPTALRRQPDDWSGFEAQLRPWIDLTGSSLAIAAAAIASVVEVEAILIDGAMPAAVRDRLVDSVRRHFSRLDLTGIEKPDIHQAHVGRTARSTGAALLPIHARYFIT